MAFTVTEDPDTVTVVLAEDALPNVALPLERRIHHAIELRWFPVGEIVSVCRAFMNCFDDGLCYRKLLGAIDDLPGHADVVALIPLVHVALNRRNLELVLVEIAAVGPEIARTVEAERGG